MKLSVEFQEPGRKKKIKRIIANIEIFIILISLLVSLFFLPNCFLLLVFFLWFSFNSGYTFYDSRKRYQKLFWNIGLAIICGFPIIYFAYLWLRPLAVFEVPEKKLRWKILFGFNLWVIIFFILWMLLAPFNNFYR